MSRAMMYFKIDGWEGNANVTQNLVLSIGVVTPKFTKGIVSWLDVVHRVLLSIIGAIMCLKVAYNSQLR